MIIPDVNLLVYAYDTESPFHERARLWWEHVLSDQRSVGVAWVAALSFIRITTNARILQSAVPVVEASSAVQGWLARRNVAVIHPGERHAELLFGLMRHVGVGGNLTTDAHLAALAIEYQAELHSNDADFSRFPGLRWRNPLK